MWTAAFLRKSWQKLDRLYNVFLAYAEGGLDAVRQLWRQITTYQRLPVKPKQLLPSFELLEDRQMPTTVQLSANAYSIPETASNVTLTATLDASSGSNVTVQYASSNGSALAGTDYSTASGTATITAGLTSTTFTVAILNYVRSSNVSFTVTLSSPTNATLGSPSSATVTIIEPPVAQLHYDDPRTAWLLPIGATQVDINLGAARLSQPLDFDLSPGTDVGGNPALVYNSATVDVRPIIQLAVNTDPNQSLPITVDMCLTWNGGSPQTPTPYFPFGFNPGDRFVGIVQVSSALTQTDYYSWSVMVTLNYTTPMVFTVSGNIPVVVADSSVSGQKDAFGAGWGIAGVNRLVPVTGGMVYAYGTGESRFFATAGGGYTSPTGEFGSLTGNATTGWTYTANGVIKEQFDTTGLMTSGVGTDNLTRAYAYDTGNRLTRVVSGDGGTATLAYDGTNHFLQSITEPGSRTLNFSQAVNSGVADLTQLTDAAGYTRTLAYDGAGTHRVANDQWGSFNTTYTHAGTGALIRVDLGASTAYSITPAVIQGFNSLVPVTQEDQATISDGLNHTISYYSDIAGRVSAQVNPVGDSLSWQYDGSGLLTKSIDGNGFTTTYGYDGYGQFSSKVAPSGPSVAYTRDGTFYDRPTVSVENGATTTNSYDSSGQITRSIGPDTQTTTFAWSSNRLASQVDPLGGTTTYAYDSNLH